MFGVAVKIYSVGRLGFFVRAQPKLSFDRHRHVFICMARKTLANLGKKKRYDSPVSRAEALIPDDVNLSRSGSFDTGYEDLDDATSGEGR